MSQVASPPSASPSPHRGAPTRVLGGKRKAAAVNLVGSWWTCLVNIRLALQALPTPQLSKTAFCSSGLWKLHPGQPHPSILEILEGIRATSWISILPAQHCTRPREGTRKCLLITWVHWLTCIQFHTLGRMSISQGRWTEPREVGQTVRGDGSPLLHRPLVSRM